MKENLPPEPSSEEESCAPDEDHSGAPPDHSQEVVPLADFEGERPVQDGVSMEGEGLVGDGVSMEGEELVGDSVSMEGERLEGDGVSPGGDRLDQGRRLRRRRDVRRGHCRGLVRGRDPWRPG